MNCSVIFQNHGKLSEKLGSLKDQPGDLEKSGIYLLECENCKDAIYIGQTKRSIGVRFEEHKTDCSKPTFDEKKKKEKPLAFHMITQGHKLKDNVKLLRNVRNPHQLDACESLFLHKNENRNLINGQKSGNCKSTLFRFSQS